MVIDKLLLSLTPEKTMLSFLIIWIWLYGVVHTPGRNAWDIYVRDPCTEVYAGKGLTNFCCCNEEKYSSKMIILKLPSTCFILFHVWLRLKQHHPLFALFGLCFCACTIKMFSTRQKSKHLIQNQIFSLWIFWILFTVSPKFPLNSKKYYDCREKLLWYYFRLENTFIHEWKNVPNIKSAVSINASFLLWVWPQTGTGSHCLDSSLI